MSDEEPTALDAETLPAQSPADPAPAPGADPAAVGGAATAKEGGLAIDDNLDFEVHLLAISSIRGIAGDIARRVDAWVGSDPAVALIVADDETVAAIADWRILSARMDALAAAFQATISEMQRAETTESAAAIVAGVSGVTGAVKVVAELLSWFAVDTSWSGRVVEVDAALRPALLGQLIARGLEPVVLAGMPAPSALVEDETSLVGRLRRLLIQRARVEALAKYTSPPKAAAAAHLAVASTVPAGEAGSSEEEDDHLAEPREPLPTDPFAQRIASMSDALDALMADVRGDKAGVGALLAASEACALAESAPAAFLLQAKVIKAGGRYKLRKHLLTYLFGMNGLTYSAGAAVTFSLTDLKRRRIVLADALFHASDEIRFAGAATTVTPSNLIGTQMSDPGLVSLPLRTPAP